MYSGFSYPEMFVGLHLILFRVLTYSFLLLPDSTSEELFPLLILSVFSFCAVLCLVAQSCLILCDAWTVACQAPLSMGILQARILDGLLCSPPGDLPNPWIKPRSPLLQEASLLSEPPGKHKNIGMGSLSLIQRNFLPKN